MHQLKQIRFRIDTKRQVPKKPATGDAFEDVLYGSESELEESDDEGAAPRPNVQPKRKNIDHGARLRIDDDEPMDLLQGAASRITSKHLSISALFLH